MTHVRATEPAASFHLNSYHMATPQPLASVTRPLPAPAPTHRPFELQLTEYSVFRILRTRIIHTYGVQGILIERQPRTPYYLPPIQTVTLDIWVHVVYGHL